MATNSAEILAFVSIAGFGVQRVIELLDPFLRRVSMNSKWAQWGCDQTTAKTWITGILGFGIGWALSASALNGDLALSLTGNESPINAIILALAISTGSNAANSLLKYGEYAKESRKVEVIPPSTVTVLPSTVTVTPGTSVQFLSVVSGTDNTGITWILLENGCGNVDDNGVYTAPNMMGTFHIAARSKADPSAYGVAVITVKN